MPNKMPWSIISWNVNGIRAILKKGFDAFLEAHQPDILCLQEIKADESQIPKLSFPFPHQYWYSADKKGYSGTAILSKYEPLDVLYGLPGNKHPQEGRIVVAEFEKLYVASIYVPNAQSGTRSPRLSYQMGS